MKKNLRILLSFFFCFVFLTVNAQHFDGHVMDKQTGLSLSGVRILTSSGKCLTHTDDEGKFAFDFEEEEFDVIFFLHGYEQKTTRFRAGISSDVYLVPLEKELEELTVTAYREKRGNNSFTYSVSDVKKITTLIGETDVMRYLQVLPGISQGMEGGMGFYVRGAGNGNNRVELDGIPIIAPTHLFGLFSTFHTDIVDKTTFQMGGIAASSGDLLSSLLQIETLTPNTKKYKGSVSLSPMMLGGALQGYLVKDKLSFQVAARTSLLKAEYQLIKEIAGEDNVSGDFNPQVQDVYTKLYWNIHPRHTAEALIYGSHDYFSYIAEEEENVTNNDIAFGWDNRVAKLRWNYTPSVRLRIETSAYYSHFKTRQRQVEQTDRSSRQGLVLGAEKTEKALQSHFFTRLKEVEINGGVDFRYQLFRPIMQKIMVNKNSEVKRNITFATSIASFFGEGKYENKNYKLKAGLRYNLYRDNDKKVFHNAEIRLQGSMFFTPNVGIEATFDRLTQFQHTLEGLPVGWSLDLIVPASQEFKPENCNQWYLGGFWGNSDFYATAGGYYKQLSNLTAYKSLLNQFSTRNVSWEQDLVKGKGASYGLELWIEKRNSRWTGSLAYTLSKTTRQFSEINGGQPYPFKFDRPHNLNIQSQYFTLKKESREQRINVAVYFSSGNNMTFPISSYQGEELPYWDTQTGGTYVPPMQDYHATIRSEMSSVNGYRLPYYFRVDAGYSFLWKGRKMSNELTISAFNILNRKNPYLIFYDQNSWKQMSILPFVPSIRWEVRF